MMRAMPRPLIISPLCVTLLLLGLGCSQGESTAPRPQRPPVDTADMDMDTIVDAPPDLPLADMPAEGCDPDAPDEPDGDALDTNCDGIDGDAMRSIFVASYGDDANPGTRQAPKKSIQAAIDLAAMDDSRQWVLIEDGLYEGGIRLVNGVNIAGGYQLGWRRTPDSFATIRGANPAISAEDLPDALTLMNLEVQPGEVMPGETVITMALERSPGVHLERVRLIGGAGGPGARGMQGATGEVGRQGARGGNGVRDSSALFCSENPQPSPGIGGGGMCGGADGARGGAPGHFNNAGSAGAAGSDGAAGGAGGASSRAGGANGAPGGRGGAGGPGTGGLNTGRFEGRQWLGQAGQAGEKGASGASGGGGGGGGGGGQGTTECKSWGGAGGGGGSGGCGGDGGSGGQAGGASVALFLIDSDITMHECRVFVGAGGAGGEGGAGGVGGQGGEGGEGGGRFNNSGQGGLGGSGGQGGVGGQGGGGAGGPAFGIYTNVALSQETGFELVEGSGGFGGNGLGAEGRGAVGATRAVQVGPID